LRGPRQIGAKSSGCTLARSCPSSGMGSKPQARSLALASQSTHRAVFWSDDRRLAPLAKLRRRGGARRIASAGTYDRRNMELEGLYPGREIRPGAPRLFLLVHSLLKLFLRSSVERLLKSGGKFRWAVIRPFLRTSRNSFLPSLHGGQLGRPGALGLPDFAKFVQ
jgi:hypothetical protein